MFLGDQWQKFVYFTMANSSSELQAVGYLLINKNMSSAVGVKVCRSELLKFPEPQFAHPLNLITKIK